MRMNPPTVTAQERQVRVINGKPRFYEPERIQAAKNLLTWHLREHRPDAPITGAVELYTVWLFPRGKAHKSGEWRITRPDTDNLQKMLKDCMTKCGYWNDDAQVAREIIEKRWSDEPTGIFIRIETLEAGQSWTSDR